MAYPEKPIYPAKRSLNADASSKENCYIEVPNRIVIMPQLYVQENTPSAGENTVGIVLAVADDEDAQMLQFLAYGNSSEIADVYNANFTTTASLTSVDTSNHIFQVLKEYLQTINSVSNPYTDYNAIEKKYLFVQDYINKRPQPAPSVTYQNVKYTNGFIFEDDWYLTDGVCHYKVTIAFNTNFTTFVINFNTHKINYA